MALDIEKLKEMANRYGGIRGNIKIDNVMRDLNDYISHLQKDNGRLRDIIKQFNNQDELAKKDEEIDSLHKQLRNQYGYNLNKEEQEEMELSLGDHMKSKHLGKRSYYSYIVTPTGLGSVLEVRCNNCKKVVYKTDNIG